jgi:hypothetical protein
MEGIVTDFAAKRIRIKTSALVIMIIIFPYTADAQAPNPSGEPFGQCARPSSLPVKIAACTQASKATTFPWILHWVYRELARAQRENGEREKAIVSYARSLAARDDLAVRKEMESLAPLTQ